MTITYHYINHLINRSPKISISYQGNVLTCDTNYKNSSWYTAAVIHDINSTDYIQYNWGLRMSDGGHGDKERANQNQIDKYIYTH